MEAAIEKVPLRGRDRPTASAVRRENESQGCTSAHARTNFAGLPGPSVLKPSSYTRALPWLAFAAIAVIGMAMQFRGITGAFLGDDFSHLDLMSRVDGQPSLWSWTLARFHEPLGNGTFAYRPLTFASFALDWIAYRDSAAGWRITSLVIYSANAILAGAIVMRWLRGQSPHALLGGVAAGCALFAYPFVGEVSYWLAGRFDLLACLFTLLFLLALPLDRRSSPALHLLRMAFLICALLSKESAIPLPLTATLLVFASAVAGRERDGSNFLRGVKSAAAEMWPAWMVLGAYLLWRTWLFGSPMKVYPSQSLASGLFEYWQRFTGIADIARGNIGAYFGAWAIVALLLFLAFLFTCIRSRRNIPKASIALMLALLACMTLYLLAPAISFPVSSPDGEGGRNFYIAWAYASLLLGVAMAWPPPPWKIGAALVALMLAGQWQSLAQWQFAGRQMNEVIAGVDKIAASIRDDQYALLLLPDHIGVAMFARTAQDSIVIPPTQHQNYLPRMAVMVSEDFATWSRYISEGKVAEIKGISRFDPANFVGLYCWNPAKSAFVPLTAGNVAVDSSLWLATAEKNFPQSGCISPF